MGALDSLNDDSWDDEYQNSVDSLGVLADDKAVTDPETVQASTPPEVAPTQEPGKFDFGNSKLVQLLKKYWPMLLASGMVLSTRNQGAKPPGLPASFTQHMAYPVMSAPYYSYGRSSQNQSPTLMSSALSNGGGYSEGGSPTYVRGGGTGRSDSIPARLSDGEYVMDAETVALLGDGSSDAGARKLDELRKKLRMDKGQKLAKGEFSDNAKDPEQYLGKLQKKYAGKKKSSKAPPPVEEKAEGGMVDPMTEWLGEEDGQ